MPPDADQGVCSTTIWAVTQSSPGPIWLTPSRTTQSSASVTSCASRYRSLSLQISLRAAPILAASPRAPRACRVTRAAPPEALRTPTPLLPVTAPRIQAVHAGKVRADPYPRTLATFGVVGGQPDVTLLGGIQGRHLPRQIVVPRPSVGSRKLTRTRPRRHGISFDGWLAPSLEDRVITPSSAEATYCGRLKAGKVALSPVLPTRHGRFRR